MQDPREALSDEKLERLRAELPDVVDAQTVRVDGRGVLYAFALPVEPVLASLREVLGDDVPVLRLALLRPVLPVVGQPDRKPQLFDTMTRWRELAAEHDVAALGGRRPVRDGRLRAGPAAGSWTA